MQKPDRRRNRRTPIRVPATIFLSADGRELGVFIIAKRGGKWDFLTTADAHKKATIEVDVHDLDRVPARLDPDAALTKRERVVLGQIVKGASNKAVARALGISPRTVEYHRANVMQKLGAKNTAELVRIVLKGR